MIRVKLLESLRQLPIHVFASLCACAGRERKREREHPFVIGSIVYHLCREVRPGQTHYTYSTDATKLPRDEGRVNRFPQVHGVTSCSISVFPKHVRNLPSVISWGPTRESQKRLHAWTVDLLHVRRTCNSPCQPYCLKEYIDILIWTCLLCVILVITMSG